MAVTVSADLFNTEEFIREVERRPAIWDANSDDYSNRMAKHSAWEELIIKSVPDINEKSVDEKYKIEMLIQRKWKSLRASYTRELLRKRKEKSRSVVTGRKPYMYFEQLRFLEASTKNTTSNIDDDGEENNEFAEEENAEKEAREETFERLQKRRRGKSSHQGLEEENALCDILKEKVTKMKDNVPESMDEDTMFMMSLVPEIKKIPDFGRLRLKSDLLNLILNAQEFYNSNVSGYKYGGRCKYYEPGPSRTSKGYRLPDHPPSPTGSELSDESLI